MNCQGKMSLGMVALLTATVFIGLGIGVVAYQSTSLIESPTSTTASVSVDTGPESVTVTVHDLGIYNKIQIQHQDSMEVLRQPGERQILYDDSVDESTGGGR